MNPIKVLLADGHQEFRTMLHEYLDTFSNITVVGEATCGDDVMKKISELRPDVVLMDIETPATNGIDTTRAIKNTWPSTKIVITTMHDNPLYRLQAERANVDGYILKNNLKHGLDILFGNDKKKKTKKST